MSNSSNRFTEKFKKADAAFNGLYKDQLNTLVGFSREEIDAITPGTTDLKIYTLLIDVVKDASRRNIKQAQLIKNIQDLGDIAITIAKKIPAFTSLL